MALIPTPVPTPNPSNTYGTSDYWNLWNQGWNSGFNNPIGAPGQGGAFSTGFSVGQQEYWKRNPQRTSSTVAPPNPIYSQPQPTPPNNQPSQPSQPNQDELRRQEEARRAEEQRQLQSQVDAVYSPTASLLNEQENFLRTSQYPNEQKQLDVVRQNALGQVATAQTNTLADLASSETKLNQSKQSAYDQAVRAYNAIKQQGNARFGQGSSTGGAVLELAGQEFARQQGLTNQNFASQIGNLLTSRSKLNDWVNQNTMQINREHEAKMSQLDVEFKNRLFQINSLRTQNEIAKSQAKFQLVQEFSNQARALENAKQQQLMNFETYKQQVDYAISAQLNGLKNQLPSVETNPFQNQTNTINQSQQNPVLGASRLIGYAPKRDQYGNEIDELINPFA